jgi:4'-phosphopantetheinyl transferase
MKAVQLDGTSTPYLAPGHVHVWRADLRDAEPMLASLDRLLSDDERARADRFRFARDRRRYVTSRGFLRRVLALYTGEEPDGIRFDYGAHGKPFLATVRNAAPIGFNVAHTDELTLFAIAATQEIGIDVERIRSDLDVFELADAAFSAGEVADLGGRPAEEQEEAFFAGWTRKEAFVKATGCGLSSRLDAFSVALDPVWSDGLLQDIGMEIGPSWSMATLRPSASHVGAVVVRGPLLAMTSFNATRFLLPRNNGNAAHPG